MPYVKPEYKARLFPLIQEIASCIIAKAGSGEDKQDLAWSLLRYAGTTILAATLIVTARTKNEIKLRYWMIAVTDGVIMNVKRELKRRKCPQNASFGLRSGFQNLYNRIKREKKALNPTSLSELFYTINGLAEEIDTIAVEKELDKKTFMGLCNYSLTTLGPLVVMDIYGENFSLEWLQILALFWEKVAEDFYQETAAPYEDAQMKKNGDCEIFALIDNRLKINVKFHT